jgi:uncharacterized protein YhbP (UPF0306 family)
MGVTLSNPSYAGDLLKDVVRRILDGNMLCAMASADGGAPHIITAFFAYDDDLNLYTLGHPDSTHSRNLTRSSGMAVAVYDSGQPWGSDHAGLQLFGTGSLAHGEAERTARSRYANRFPLYLEFAERRLQEGSPAPASSFPDFRFYVFEPARVKILAERDFGDEVVVDATCERG